MGQGQSCCKHTLRGSVNDVKMKPKLQTSRYQNDRESGRKKNPLIKAVGTGLSQLKKDVLNEPVELMAQDYSSLVAQMISYKRQDVTNGASGFCFACWVLVLLWSKLYYSCPLMPFYVGSI